MALLPARTHFRRDPERGQESHFTYFLKIDMELVRDIHVCHAKQVIVAGIVSIVRALDMQVIGEGVELRRN